MEQLIVYKCREKLDFSVLSDYARKQISNEGFGLLAGNVYFDDILKGKWFDASARIFRFNMSDAAFILQRNTESSPCRRQAMKAVRLCLAGTEYF